MAAIMIAVVATEKAEAMRMALTAGRVEGSSHRNQTRYIVRTDAAPSSNPLCPLDPAGLTRSQRGSLRSILGMSDVQARTVIYKHCQINPAQQPIMAELNARGVAPCGYAGCARLQLACHMEGRAREFNEALASVEAQTNPDLPEGRAPPFIPEDEGVEELDETWETE
jgi:hypothetical protein